MPWEIINQIQRIGFVGGLLLLGWLFYTKKIRLGSDYDEMKGERDRWMRSSLKTTEVSRRAVRLADKAGNQKAGDADEGIDEEDPDD